MKILFLNGSPRKNGHTASLMKCIEKGIDSSHTEEWLNAYDLNVKPCRPNKQCILPKDDGHMVFEKIKSSDALVIGSPTYFGNISGQLKIIIDRNLTAFENMPANGLEIPTPMQKGKNAIIVTSCNSPAPISTLPTQAVYKYLYTA